MLRKQLEIFVQNCADILDDFFFPNGEDDCNAGSSEHIDLSPDFHLSLQSPFLHLLPAFGTHPAPLIASLTVQECKSLNWMIAFTSLHKSMEFQFFNSSYLLLHHI